MKLNHTTEAVQKYIDRCKINIKCKMKYSPHTGLVWPRIDTGGELL
jgi:hypothetical protein